MRALSPEAQAALSMPTVMVALLVEMDLDGGQLLLNHSSLDLTVDGAVYLGTRGLGQVESIAAAPGEMPRVRFTMSGVPSDMVALALSEPVQGRSIRAKLVLYDSDTGLALNVSPCFIGILSSMSLQDGRDGAAIVVTAESGVRDLHRPSAVMYSHLDQQRLAPGDMAWQFNNAQVEQKIVFPAREWFIKNKG